MMIDPEDEGEVFANRLIASTLINKETEDFLSSVHPETRIALEGLLADGLIEQHENGFFITEKGQSVLSQIEEMFPDGND
jgi:ribosomal protein S19E (S16A)